MDEAMVVATEEDQEFQDPYQVIIDPTIIPHQYDLQTTPNQNFLSQNLRVHCVHTMMRSIWPKDHLKI